MLALTFWDAGMLALILASAGALAGFAAAAMLSISRDSDADRCSECAEREMAAHRHPTSDDIARIRARAGSHSP